MPVRLLRFLCRNEPAEGIGETRRHLVTRLTLADSRIGRRSEVIAVAQFADHGRETEVVELPAEDTCVEGDRRFRVRGVQVTEVPGAGSVRSLYAGSSGGLP